MSRICYLVPKNDFRMFEEFADFPQVFYISGQMCGNRARCSPLVNKQGRSYDNHWDSEHHGQTPYHYERALQAYIGNI